MKYIIDIDALKACLKLLQNPFIENGKACVYLHEVEAMLDSFPKDEYPVKPQTVWRDTLNPQEAIIKYLGKDCKTVNDDKL
jgi:hypothetical protein